MNLNRRQTLKGAAWSAPLILATTAIPAYAASNEGPYGFVFDGGGGTNGLLNSMYLNFGTTDGSTQTLAKPVIVTIDVVGLNTNTTTERSFTPGSSDGVISSRTYNPATRITSFVWTLPSGTVVPPLPTSGLIPTSIPDVLFSFGDGLAGTRRITNKVVVTSVSGTNRLSQTFPLDSSVVKDYNRNAASPDGIY